MTKILVAEDDPEIRELIEFKLRGTGFDVHAFPDGEAALAEKRAAAVRDWLVENAGIDPARLAARGTGGAADAGASRVEFRIRKAP